MVSWLTMLLYMIILIFYFVIGGDNTKLIPLPTNCGIFDHFEYIHEGSNRKYGVYLPAMYCDLDLFVEFLNEYTHLNNNNNFDINTDKISLPILLLFHGYTESPEQYLNRWQWTDLIEQYGFITIIPFGGGDNRIYSWNAKVCCGDNRNENINDIGFIYNLLLDIIYSLNDKFLFLDLDINNNNNNDKINIFLTGMSNGGFMSDQIAWSFITDYIPITSIVPVAGYIYDNTQLLLNRNNTNPMNIMYVHGIDDITVNIDGCGCNLILQSDTKCCCEIGEYSNNICLLLKDAFFRWTDWNQCDQDMILNNFDLFGNNNNNDALCVYATPNNANCNSLNAICLLENAEHDIHNFGKFEQLKIEIWTFFLRSLCLKQGGAWNEDQNLCDCLLNVNTDLYCSNNINEPTVKTTTQRPTRRIKDRILFPGNHNL